MRRALIPLVAAAMLFCTLPALAQEAQTLITVTRTMDFFVVVEHPTFFEAETDLCQDTDAYWCSRPEQGGHFTDSVLWLYGTNGEALAINDDDPRRNGQSWNSYIGITLEPGTYRLRAGRFFCTPEGCINPAAPFDEGGHYDLIANLPLLLDPEPPTGSPPPIPSVLPSPSIEPSPSESPSPTEVPTDEPTQTPPPTPEPTVEPSAPVEPTPTISIEPSPTIEPSPNPSPTPSLEPRPSPVAPSPTPSATPTPESPSPSPSAPIEPSPSPEASVEPTPEPSPDSPAEVAAVLVGKAAQAVAEAVGEAVQAVGEAAAFVANLGHDITPAEKRQAAATIVPAIIITQIAQAAVAAAATAAATGSAARKVK